MSRGVNKVVLIGFLGQDPQLRELPAGTPVCNATLATNEAWKDRETGEQRQRTEWHRLTFFDRLADIAGMYLRKGAQIYIAGSLRTRKRQDQTGQDRYTTEIIVAEMQMLGGGESRANTHDEVLPKVAPSPTSPLSAALTRREPSSKLVESKETASQRKPEAAKQPAFSGDDSDELDDIPF